MSDALSQATSCARTAEEVLPAPCGGVSTPGHHGHPTQSGGNRVSRNVLRLAMAMLAVSKGVKCEVVAEEVMLYRTTVAIHARRLGLPIGKPGQTRSATPEWAIEQALDVVRNGGKYAEAAALIGVCKTAIGRWARERGVPRRRAGRATGQTLTVPHPRSQRVLRLHAIGEDPGTIARRLGMHSKSVRAILRLWLPRMEAA